MNARIPDHPFIHETVTLSPESIEFAIWEGEELWKNRRRIHPGDTKETKIRNSLLGAFGQQVLIEEIGARRVTKEECPGFAYDVVVAHEALEHWIDWVSQNKPENVPAEARIEVKDLGMSNRAYISFYDENVEHARKCASRRQYDYMICFGVEDFDQSTYTAQVSLLGLLPARTVANTRLWHQSGFKENMKYIKESEINHDHGIIFF